MELMVVLAVLGVAAGVVGFAALPRERWSAHARDGTAEIAAARREAVASGTPVPVDVAAGDVTARVLAMPDGSVIGADRFGFDPLSGRVLNQDDRRDYPR